MRKVAVIQQDPEEIVEKPVLARAILDISLAMKSILASGLTESAVVILVAHDTRLGQRDVSLVLESLKDLASKHTHGVFL